MPHHFLTNLYSQVYIWMVNGGIQVVTFYSQRRSTQRLARFAPSRGDYTGTNAMISLSINCAREKFSSLTSRGRVTS